MNKLFEGIVKGINPEIQSRRYNLPELISESYKACYGSEEGSNLHRLAESHLEDLKKNPKDIERLSYQLSTLKSLALMVESNELKDEDLVDKGSYDTVDPNEDRILQGECNESNDQDLPPHVAAKCTAEKSHAKAIENREKRRLRKSTHKKEEVHESKTMRESFNWEKLGSRGSGDYYVADCGNHTAYIQKEYDDEEKEYYYTISIEEEGVGEIDSEFESFYTTLKDAKKAVEEWFRKNESKTMRESFNWEKSIKESDDPDFTDDELEELAKRLETLRKERKNAPKTDINESVPSSADFVAQHDSPKNYRANPKGFDKAYEILDKYGSSDEDVDVVYDRMSDEDKVKVYNYVSGSASMSEAKEDLDESDTANRRVWQLGVDIFCPEDKMDAVKDAVEDAVIAVGPECSVSGIMWGDNSWTAEEYGIKESTSYKGLENFRKQSESKAFYKTFKKMHEALKEGRALSRQESIGLYKAANSALTQMSIELEHNPEFLTIFKESSTLLSKDVNSLRESLARGKAPSKKTMKSLAKFSESLLNESETLKDFWRDADGVYDFVDRDGNSIDDMDYPESTKVLSKKDDGERTIVKLDVSSKDKLKESEDEDFVGDDEGDIQSDEATAFDQEYADARVALYKELAEKHAGDQDVQDKLAQDAEEITNLPGITDEQIADLNGESTEGDPDSASNDDIEPEEDDSEITDDELEELKRHLQEYRQQKIKE